MNLNLDSYFGFTSLAKAKELENTLLTPLFTFKDTGTTVRMLDHWDRQNLLANDRQESDKWRRFNFIEYAWIKVIQEFRDMGLPLAIIKELRQAMFRNISIKWIYETIASNPELVDQSLLPANEKADLNKFLADKEYEHIDVSEEFSLFYYLVVNTIVRREPVSILLFKDGHTIVRSPLALPSQKFSDIEDERSCIFETYTSVSLATVIKNFITEKESFLSSRQLPLLEPKELKVLELINSGEYESITINFRNRKIKSLELVKEQDVKRKVVDILTDGAYQDITIKSHGGMVTKIQNTLKIFL